MSDSEIDEVSSQSDAESSNEDTNAEILNLTPHNHIQIQEHQRLFENKIEEYAKGIPNKNEYDRLVSILSRPEENKSKKTNREYHFIKKCSVITFSDGKARLVYNTGLEKATNADGIDLSNLPRLIFKDELFDCIREVHINKSGHGAARKTHECLQQYYSNISRTMCDVFVDLCTCRLDKKLPGRPEDIKPIISKTFNSRGQVDLIDMQTCPDGQFKWLLHYQDHADKLSILRPLIRKEAARKPYLCCKDALLFCSRTTGKSLWRT